MATQDGAVTAGDLMKACREMNRRTPEQASAWMAEIEPLVVHYIETTASQIAGTLAMTTTKIEDVRRIALEVRKMGMVIMRSTDWVTTAFGKMLLHQNHLRKKRNSIILMLKG